ncbi:Heme-degrading monooxygenase HmoA [Parageobacillus thermantarcticus]|uniref:Heme-degrading monooxygenase HmoA n=1 Tax=Parageobacillus thermantarcticus TaxID=186116 RepID=A0A1I0TQW7_9BACL|nr:antibiotic biosynthesis monooxygenase [Parageobacillus thermantarcticus]SFA54164.1 Heme-degrading monooxygenase HmoA [Parageobacillus thermantarcticus]
MEKPYYAVIFTSQRTDGDHGYEAMAKQMVELASQQPGFLGVDSIRDKNGIGITVSYWDSLEAIQQWKKHAAHQIAQEKGKQQWYERYSVRVCKVEREHGFKR